MGSLLTKKILKQPNDTDGKTSASSKKSSPILKWLGRFFMGLGIMMSISVVLSIVTLSSLMSDNVDQAPLPEKFALAHSFGQPMPDFINENSFIAQLFPNEQTSLHDFMLALDHAKQNDHVTHFVARIKDGEYSLTQIQELRKAIIDFKSSGKKTYAYFDTMGSLSNVIAEYWLATAFDEIWMQPVGSLAITGISIEQPFIKNTLDKIGITMDMEQRKAYKTGPEMYTRTGMSKENAETVKSIGKTIMQTIVDDIADARSLSPIRVKKLIDHAPLTLDEALNVKLIDKIAYLDELEDLIKNNQVADFIFTAITRYKSEISSQNVKENASVVIINIDGMILDEDPYAKSNQPLILGVPDKVAAADVISNAINNSAKKDDVKTIILNINSPGGSPTASEVIRRAVVRAKEKGKFVIAHMGDVAASGGYWIATHADLIIASPLTITGSIGVYGGKPDLSKLWDKIGVNWDTIQYGDNAGMWSLNKPYSESEKRRISIMMDEIYKQFVDRVADGRDMNIIAVEKVAQGRAWIGKKATDINLVDTTSGLKGALIYAAASVELNNWQDLNIEILPANNDPWAELMDNLPLPMGIQIPIKTPEIFAPLLMPNAVTMAPHMVVHH